MSTRSLGITLSAIFVFAVLPPTQSAQAAGGRKAKAANPHKLTADKADAMVVQLANNVFGQTVKGHNTALDRKEFHTAQDLLRAEMVTWLRSGTLAQIRQSGWKPINLAGAATSTPGTSGTGVNISKIEKALKVALPEFTDYTRYWVQEALDHQSELGKPNASKPGRAVRPAARRQVSVKKQVSTSPKPAHACKPKASVVNTSATK